MLTKIEMETMEAIKSFCRRENKKTHVKTFEFNMNNNNAETCDLAINAWIAENGVTVVSLQHRIDKYAVAPCATYVLLYHK